MDAQTFNARVATPTTRLIGAMAIVSMAWVVIGGLIVTPKDVDQGDAVRIMYVHVPTAWVAYLAFIVTALASACWLLSRKHSMGFDRVAGASAEVGVIFMAMTLLSGSLWGRITWGSYWAWDPRLTTTSFTSDLHRLLGSAWSWWLARTTCAEVGSDCAARSSRNSTRALQCVDVALVASEGKCAEWRW